MPYPLGQFKIANQTFHGRLLDGRANGEKVDLPLEGDQGASESWIIPESELSRFTEAILGKADDVGNDSTFAITPHKHFLFNRLVVIGLHFTPHQPRGPENDAYLISQGVVADAGEGAATVQRNCLWRADVSYAEDRGWVDKWSARRREAVVDQLVPQTGASKKYTIKTTVPFPESVLTVARRRVPRFQPQETLLQLGKINSANVVLPASKTILVNGTALFQTFTAEFFNLTYGLRYWSVSYEFLVQPWSWNVTPQRDTRELVALKRPDGTDFFAQHNMIERFVGTEPYTNSGGYT